MTPSAGLQIVRIAWVTAILAGVFAILFGLLFGSDGGDSSGGSPQAASAPGFAFEAEEKPEKAGAAALRDDRNQPADGRLPGEGPPASGALNGSADQPGDAAGRAPEVTSQPSEPAPQPKPTPAPQPKPTPPPRPKPPPPPPQLPVSPQPTAPEPVQSPVNIANNNDGP